jgi:hypothetical protein
MENALLAKLMDEDRQRLMPHMMRTDLPAQAVLQRAGEEVVHTWFPCGSATAAFRVWIDETNPAVEVALVGSEGAVGGIVSNGNVPAFATCHVQAGRNHRYLWQRRPPIKLILPPTRLAPKERVSVPAPPTSTT